MSSSLLNKILLSPTVSTPASNRTCNNNNNDDAYDSSSRFQRTVCLYDWWLIKAEKEFQGKRLAVAGFTSRELQAMRVFTSAPIIKRYDVFTLETADGICIIIKGFINKSRTIENGFSSEVFSHFVFGFPTYWEAYNEKLLEKEFTTGTSSATCPDLNKSAVVSEFAAVSGMANPRSNTAPSKYKKEYYKTKHNSEDISKSSKNVSERITNNASKGLDLSNRTAAHDNTDNAKNYTSENLPPSISCVINTSSLLDDNLAAPTEPSSRLVPESSERMVNSKGNREGKEGTVKKSKTKELSNLESIIIIHAVSEESPLPKDSDNLNRFTLDPDLSRGNLEMQKKYGRNKDGLNCGNKSCSTTCSPQDSEATVRYTGEKSGGVECSCLLSSSLGVMHKDSLSTSPGDPNVPEVSGNCVDDTTIFPVLHSDITMNIITPSHVDTTAVNIAQNNSGCRKPRSGLRNLKGKRKEEFGFMGSDKHKSKELISEISGRLKRENLKRCSSQGTIHSGRRTGAPEATVNQSMSRIIRDLHGKSEGKDKGKPKIICGLKARRYKRNSVSVISARTRNIMQDDTLERMNVFNLCDDELQDPTHNIVVKDNSKQRQDHKKSSAIGTPRQNLNKLGQCPGWPGDSNHQSHVKTAVGEKERNTKGGGSSRKKARRKIDFDTHASPLTQERKEKISIVSPESLSLKRSRSGRLLLPSLDFWRNQIAVYDADRKITGIQESIGDVKQSKGSKSEPRKKQRERA